MRISTAGLDLIKQCEGVRLKAYKDGGGVWTVGYGHTYKVYPGMTIDNKLADKFLLDDIWHVEQAIEDYVTVTLNQNQYDALCCFIFNVGDHAFSESTMLRKLNKGDYAGAANEFPRWNRDNGKVIAGLTARRLLEQTLFLS
jgi:lysozyme